MNFFMDKSTTSVNHTVGLHQYFTLVRGAFSKEETFNHCSLKLNRFEV